MVKNGKRLPCSQPRQNAQTPSLKLCNFHKFAENAKKLLTTLLTCDKMYSSKYETRTCKTEKQRGKKKMKNTPFKNLLSRGIGWYEYSIHNCPEEWTKQQILDFADNDNFGGEIYARYANTVVCKVYID